jgi:hypothetical protein
MIDGDLFDKLVSYTTKNSNVTLHSHWLQECIARRVRKNEAPFGGIQVRLLALELVTQLTVSSLYCPVISASFLQFLNGKTESKSPPFSPLMQKLGIIVLDSPLY